MKHINKFLERKKIIYSFPIRKKNIYLRVPQKKNQRNKQNEQKIELDNKARMLNRNSSAAYRIFLNDCAAYQEIRRFVCCKEAFRAICNCIGREYLLSGLRLHPKSCVIYRIPNLADNSQGKGTLKDVLKRNLKNKK